MTRLLFRNLALIAGLGFIVISPGVAAADFAYTVRPDVSLVETYTDNFDGTADNRRDELTTTVGAGLTGSAVSPRLSASLGGRVGAEFYMNDSDEQGRPTYEGSATLAYRFTRRLTIRLADTVRLARQQQSDAVLAIPTPAPVPVPGPVPTEPPPAVGPGAVFTRRVRELNNVALGELDYELGAFSSARASYLNSVTRYDAPDLVDTETHEALFDISHRISVQNTLGAQYTFRFFQFDSTTASDRQTHEASLSWAHNFTETFVMRLSAGGTVADRPDDSSLRVVGWTGAADVSKRVGETLFAANYSHSVGTSGGVVTLLGTDVLTLGVSRRLFARVTGQLGAAYSRSEAIEASTGTLTSYSGAAGLSAELVRWLRMSLSYAYEEADAADGGRPVRMNTVTAALSVLLPGFESRQF